MNFCSQDAYNESDTSHLNARDLLKESLPSGAQEDKH